MSSGGLCAVIDASVAVDLFAGRREERVYAAEQVFSCLAYSGTTLYAPNLFLVEAAGVLLRFLPRTAVEEVLTRLKDHVSLISDSEFLGEALEAALLTGSRGADAYYIGLARALGCPLVTSDRIQAGNALKSGVKAFYVIEESSLRDLLSSLGCSSP